MLREIRDLGFEYAELSHGIRLSLVPGILDAVEAGEIKISTLHNFCPLPIGVDKPSPNLYEFSSDRPRDRELALKHTFKTLEFARRVNATLVVLHLGSMELKDYGGKLEDMLEYGLKDSTKYKKILAEAVAKREAKKRTAMVNLYDSLKKVVPEAERLGLKLGCENRESVQEIPLESDFPGFCATLTALMFVIGMIAGTPKSSRIWAFIRHEEFLASLAGRLAGFHIHDVQFPASDHCPPGAGDIDYAALKPYVQPHHLKVFELSPRVPVDAALCGIQHLKSIWGNE
jgi:sugar phosphate isomerase/epimerase